MNGKLLRESLKEGRKVFGTFICSESPRWLEIIGSIGLDYVFIDTEHIAMDRIILSWMCQAYKAKEIAPIVRIPMPDPYYACMALDGGAEGIVAPYVESVEEIRQLVGAVKYKPLKGKKLNDFLLGKIKLEKPLEDYLNATNNNKTLMVNIESVQAMEHLDELLSVPGLDAIIIGPHDLTCSLGIPEQYSHPEFYKAVEFIIKKSRSKGISAGMHVIFPALKDEMMWVNMGANVILHSGDILAFKNSMTEEIKLLKQSAGIKAESELMNVNI